VEVQVLSSAPRPGTRSQGRVSAFSGSVERFPGSEADLECSGNLAHDQPAAQTFSGVGVGDYYDVPIPPGSYPENFPYGLNYTLIPARAPYAGYVLDLGSATMFHPAGAPAATRPITLYSVHSQDRNVRVLRNGRVVKRGPALLSVNGRWTWTPRRHGTYVVRWTSRGVAHARSVTR
jgi:hypothetical protein